MRTSARGLGLLLLLGTGALAQAPEGAPTPAPVQAPAGQGSAEKDADPARRAGEPEVPKWTPLTEGADDGLSLGWTLVRTLVVLGIVLGTIYLALNVGLRRLMGVAVPGARGLVSVVERVQLDQKRALFVVRAAGEYLLLGGGDSGLSLITKLDAAEVERFQKEQPAGAQWSPLLRKLSSRKGPTPPSA